jgi:hypothetical protein
LEAFWRNFKPEFSSCEKALLSLRARLEVASVIEAEVRFFLLEPGKTKPPRPGVIPAEAVIATNVA